MKERRIGDFVVQIRGVSYKPTDIKDSSDVDAVPLLRANNIQEDGLNFDDLVYVDKKKISDAQFLRSGDILICSSSGSKNLVGKAAFVEEDLPFAFGAFCKVVRTNSVLPRYLGQYFQSPRYRREIADVSAGVNINNIRNEHIDNLLLPYHSDEEQTEIANILEKIDGLIAGRRKQLAKLDELVKARFVEMFGDTPDEHKVTMADICKIITDGTHQPPEFVSSGIPFLFVSNIVSNVITYETEKHISDDTYRELTKRTPIEIGDVLLSTVGSYGHPAVVKEDRPFCFQRHIAYLKPYSDRVNSTYLYGAILSTDVQRQIEERVKGIAQKTLNLSEIQKLRFPLPPMELQNKFAAFVQSTDQVKATIQASLDELETLKKSLMQEYFE